MSTVTKFVIVLAIAAIVTIIAFYSLSKLFVPPTVNAEYRPSAEIIIDSKYIGKDVEKNIERPSMSEVKNRPPVLEEEILVIDHPAQQPPVRVPPIMPKNAKNSGSCTFDLEFDVKGKVKSVNNLKCTDTIFIEPTQTALKKWVFGPKVENGKRVEFSLLNQKITYLLHDDDGSITP